MIENFTSTEFADLLKKHGIEIDTPYTHFEGAVYAYSLFQGRYTMVLVAGQILGNAVEISVRLDEIEIIPAYPITKALNWLPIIKDFADNRLLYKPATQMAGYISFADGGTWMPVELLVENGLHEGWLTKESIAKNIEENLARQKGGK